MKEKHTPGPWKKQHRYGSVDLWGNIDGKLHMVADITECTEADKSLIASAPELLEALEMLMPQAPSRGECDEYDRAMWDNAAIAIAKAKGDKP